MKEKYYLLKTKKEKILRYLRFKEDQNEDDFIRDNLLILFFWRNEENNVLKVNKRKLYDDNKIAIVANSKMYNKINADDLEEGNKKLTIENDKKELENQEY